MNEQKPYQQNQDEDQTYRQQLGLKKMLYKYEHQNQQLKAQIKALTQRLADIVAKKDEPPQQPPQLDPSQEYRLNLLKQEMKRLYAEIQRTNSQIKINKQQINQFQQLRCVQLTNQIKKEQKQIQNYKQKIKKYQKMQQMKGFSLQSFDLKNSSLRINTHHDKLKQMEEELEKTRKHIRQLEKYRDQHDRVELKKHSYVVTINSKARQITNSGKQIPAITEESSKEKKGIWNLDYTQENYKVIKQELNELKKEKQRLIQSLKNENIVLKNRFAQISIQAQQLNKSIHLPQIEPPKLLQKKSFRVKNQVAKLSNSINVSRVQSPPKLLHVGPGEFEKNNDKNFSPKKLRKVQWQSANHRTSGIQWNDAHLRSPISGVNLWFDSSLIGIQFLHRMGQSTQHLHLTEKGISPIQYRLNGNDYVANIVLWISDNKIVGIQLASKAGRNDGFGSRGKGRKFDFQIKDLQKPVFSFGKFRINNNVSEITKLGFQIV